MRTSLPREVRMRLEIASAHNCLPMRRAIVTDVGLGPCLSLYNMLCQIVRLFQKAVIWSSVWYLSSVINLHEPNHLSHHHRFSIDQSAPLCLWLFVVTVTLISTQFLRWTLLYATISHLYWISYSYFFRLFCGFDTLCALCLLISSFCEGCRKRSVDYICYMVKCYSASKQKLCKS